MEEARAEFHRGLPRLEYSDELLRLDDEISHCMTKRALRRAEQLLLPQFRDAARSAGQRKWIITRHMNLSAKGRKYQRHLDALVKNFSYLHMLHVSNFRQRKDEYREYVAGVRARYNERIGHVHNASTGPIVIATSISPGPTLSIDCVATADTLKNHQFRKSANCCLCRMRYALPAGREREWTDFFYICTACALYGHQAKQCHKCLSVFRLRDMKDDTCTVCATEKMVTD